jgi:hypothetical protein
MNKQALPKFILCAAVLIASVGVVGGNIPQSGTINLEVKEPLEILPHSSLLILFPGETLEFQVTVENHASVTYNTSLSFSLNDTEYEKYITFSNTVYAVEPGRNILDAWLNVSSTAPASKLEVTIKIVRDVEPSIPDGLAPSLELFVAGAVWAAGDGNSVLYINWYDNYRTHHLSDGADWGPWWREGQLEQIKNVMAEVMEHKGFAVTCAGDVPENMSDYDLVVFEAWFAVEPQHGQIVRDYLNSGGSVVILSGVPCYFATYCKDLWPYVTGGLNLSSIQDWFGSAAFVNSGGTANLVVDKPFGTSLENQSKVYHIDAYGCYALASMSDEAHVVARWGDGAVYAFTHEYGNGRVFYQAEMDW